MQWRPTLNRESKMNMMSLPAIVGISFGVAIVMTFSKKSREQSGLKRLLNFVMGFVAMLAVLIAVNFGIYYSNQP